MENVLQNVSAVLSTTPRRWEDLARSLPADLAARRPAPGEWSAVECLQHLLDTEAIFTARVGYFLAGQDFPAFNPDQEGTSVDGEQSFLAMAARFTRLRQQSLALLASLSPDDLNRRARHADLGPVTLAEMVHEWAAHDFNHTMQAERALMQPFIAGCGAWQMYFEEFLIA